MESYLLLDKERKLQLQLGNFASAAEHLLGSVPLDELSLVLRVRKGRDYWQRFGRKTVVSSLPRPLQTISDDRCHCTLLRRRRRRCPQQLAAP